jgi:hypothetical protein
MGYGVSKHYNSAFIAMATKYVENIYSGENINSVQKKKEIEAIKKEIANANKEREKLEAEIKNLGESKEKHKDDIKNMEKQVESLNQQNLIRKYNMFKEMSNVTKYFFPVQKDGKIIEAWTKNTEPMSLLIYRPWINGNIAYINRVLYSDDTNNEISELNSKLKGTVELKSADYTCGKLISRFINFKTIILDWEKTRPKNTKNDKHIFFIDGIGINNIPSQSPGSVPIQNGINDLFRHNDDYDFYILYPHISSKEANKRYRKIEKMEYPNLIFKHDDYLAIVKKSHVIPSQDSLEKMPKHQLPQHPKDHPDDSFSEIVYLDEIVDCVTFVGEHKIIYNDAPKNIKDIKDGFRNMIYDGAQTPVAPTNSQLSAIQDTANKLLAKMKGAVSELTGEKMKEGGEDEVVSAKEGKKEYTITTNRAGYNNTMNAGNSITIIITRSEKLLGQNTSIYVQTINGNAKGDQDFDPIAKNISFKSFEQTKTIVIRTREIAKKQYPIKFKIQIITEPIGSMLDGDEYLLDITINGAQASKVNQQNIHRRKSIRKKAKRKKSTKSSTSKVNQQNIHKRLFFNIQQSNMYNL